MTSSNGNIFRVTGPLCGEFTGHQWIPPPPPPKAGDELWWCFFGCAWTNGWVNNRDAADLRRHRAHYDVTVMHLNVSIMIKIIIHPNAPVLCYLSGLCSLKRRLYSIEIWMRHSNVTRNSKLPWSIYTNDTWIRPINILNNYTWSAYRLTVL